MLWKLSGVLAGGIVALFAFEALGFTAPKTATDITRASNAEYLKPPLDYSDTTDFDRVSRGLVATTDSLIIPNTAGDGGVVWNMDRFAFIQDDTPAPDTVNPSLWRQARLNTRHGLYEVTTSVFQGETRHLWQIRGYDMANISFVEGDQGFILIDPLTSQETAQAALQFFYLNLPAAKQTKPITHIIITHSHVDHFGGIRAILDSDKMAPDYHIWAPEGFLEAAVSENILAGAAMSRRSRYMYGGLLPAGERGYVDSGLGKALSNGTISLVAPSRIIREDGSETLDGLEVEFLMANGTEAPAEMCFYFPAYKALCVAEVANANMHNLLTPRGAEIRDPMKWSKALDRMASRWGGQSEVVFGPHHWPRWGAAEVQNYLTKQRDAYRYLHDQTLHLANKGYGPVDIAEMLILPDSLRGEWFLRDYYGTVNFNVKAIYQKYLGWFDGNPIHLHALPPQEAARCYMQYIPASSGNLLVAAQMAFADGQYRWVVEILEHVVSTQPDNTEAWELQADAFEQMGYQAESGVWRHIYLTAALRGRNPLVREALVAPVRKMWAPDVAAALTVETLLDYYATFLDGPAASQAASVVINWSIANPDGEQEDWYVALGNGVLNNWPGHAAQADCTVALTRQQFQDVIQIPGVLAALLTQEGVEVTGDNTAVLALLDQLTTAETTTPVSANARMIHVY